MHIDKDEIPGSCSICSRLADQEWASQKYDWEENDTRLPAAAGELKMVRDLKPDSERSLQLWQCLLCNTYYRYESDYEYLANGSEDRQSLTRLKAEEAKQYLDQPSDK
jgi:hypothetical protein